MENQSSYYLNTLATEPVFIQGSLQKVAIRICLAITITVLNLITVVTFATIKKKTFSNVLFLSSSLSDMMIGFIHIPFAIIPNLYTFYPLGSGMCYFTTFVSGFNFQVTTDTLVILTVHRFLLVTRPLSQTEKLSWKKMVIICVPWLFRIATGLINIFVNVSLGRYNYAACIILFEKTYLLLEHIIIVLMPWFVELSFIILTIAILAIKKRAKVATTRVQTTNKIKETTQNNTRAHSSVKHGNDHSGSHQAATNNSDTRMAIRQNKCNQLMRHLLRGFNKDTKAILCLAVILLNMTIFELPFLLALPYALICFCVFDLIYYLDTLAYLFPLFNPIIIFIFHDSFRTQFFSLIKKIF